MPRLACGDDAMVAVATHPDADLVLFASSGTAGLDAVLAAIDAGKTIALANKEILVMAGRIVMERARQRGVAVLPVDSEHNAIHQCLDGRRREHVRRLVLTASGGPFRGLSTSDIARVTPDDALRHPTWRMGPKITIDSATLMNKGLEIIEAHWLFSLPYEQIEVVVHPESVVHSLVEFIDSGHTAQLGLPDMRVPIQYALTYPERMKLTTRRLDLAEVGALHFERPDADRFPALRIAREAGIVGRTYPTVLSAADDEAVRAFLAGDLRFVDIPAAVEIVLEKHQPADVTIETIWEADRWARTAAGEAVTAMRSWQR
jgi:1-deoxy-D-xylulose-5-phosphate reductoisomerase